MKLLFPVIIFTTQKIEDIEEDFYSNLKTKSVQSSGELYDKFPKLSCVPRSLKMDYSRILNKPFFVGNFNWSDTSSRYSNLTIGYNFPSIIQSNYLASVPFKSASFCRLRACFLLQVAGTPMHQGVLLAGVTPYNVAKPQVNTLMSCPHAFLSANESTSVCVEIPYYAAAPLVHTGQYPEGGLASNDYAELTVLVMNPLVPSTSGTTTLSVSIHVVIREEEFYVPKNSEVKWIGECGPKLKFGCAVSTKMKARMGKKVNSPPSSFHGEGFLSSLYKIPTKVFDGLANGAKVVTGDFIDTLRMGIRELTGFHNPNSPAINNRAIITQRNFGNNVDQPNLFEKLDQHAQFDRIVQDYQFNTAQDEMDVQFILKKPAFVNRFVVNTSLNSGDRLFSLPITPFIEADQKSFVSPLRTFYEGSRYWSGSLRLHIQSSMTNFQYCKLLVVRNYVTDNRVLTTYPDMNGTHNLITDTLEFSAGGQMQEIDLPYCSTLEQLPCTKYLDANAMMHGVVHIYLLQSLTTSGTAPLEVEFNVYMSVGDDFQFYGYANDLLSMSSPVPMMSLADEHTSLVNSLKGGFAAQSEVTVRSTDQQGVMVHSNETDEREVRCEDFKPMTSVRDYIRRMTQTSAGSFTCDGQNKGVQVISVLDLFRPQSQTSANMAIRGLFWGFTGGFKLKIMVRGINRGSCWYIPPGMNWQAGHDYFSPTRPGDPTNNPSFIDRYEYQGVAVAGSYPVQEIPLLVPGTDSCQYEFVIPNMNAFRFVASKFLTPRSGVNNEASSDMGHIVIAHDSKEAKITYHILTGFTDESRLGFQVTPYTKEVIVTSGGGGEVLRQTAFNSPVPPYAPGIDATVYPGAYFNRL